MGVPGSARGAEGLWASLFPADPLLQHKVRWGPSLSGMGALKALVVLVSALTVGPILSMAEASSFAGAPARLQQQQQQQLKLSASVECPPPYRLFMHALRLMPAAIGLEERLERAPSRAIRSRGPSSCFLAPWSADGSSVPRSCQPWFDAGRGCATHNRSTTAPKAKSDCVVVAAQQHKLWGPTVLRYKGTSRVASVGPHSAEVSMPDTADPLPSMAAARAAAAAAVARAKEAPPVVAADLPHDSVLRRPYPSFEDPAVMLPPRGLSDLPQGPGRETLAALGGADVGVGALGKGARLWNVLGRDSKEVDAAVDEERRFVEERWLSRLAETHRLVDQHHNAVREEQAEKLRKMPQPVWAIPVDSQDVEAPAPLAYDFRTYGPYFDAYIESTKGQVSTSELALDAVSGVFVERPLLASASKPKEKRQEQQRLRTAAAAALASGDVYGPAASGFRLKQITAPVPHRRGITSFFYFHAPHSAPYVPFINACRRETFTLPRPAVTALKVENLDSFVDAPSHSPLQAAGTPQLQPDHRPQQQQKGIPPSAYMSRLPVEVGMCVIGMREDVEDLVENLRQIIFRRKPKAKQSGPSEGPRKGTFQNPWVASLSVKGPIAAVAGDLVLPDELEVINKSQYLCTMNANYYLNFKVKIEEIEEYVLPEFGYSSLNRDIDADGFFYFASYCTPVLLFGFEAQRVPEAVKSTPDEAEHLKAVKHYGTTSFHDLQRQRHGRNPSTDPVHTHYSGCLPSGARANPSGAAAGSADSLSFSDAPSPSGEAAEDPAPTSSPADPQVPLFPYESLGEVVTIEIHTDGSATPRQAFLEALNRVQNIASSVTHALIKNCKESRDGSVEEEFEDPDMYQDKHRYIGVPWNPYKDSLTRTLDRHKTFFRKDMLRQYSPVTEQLMARRDQFGVKGSPSSAGAAQTQRKPCLEVEVQKQAGDEEASDEEVERLLDEEELEDELVQRSPTIRVEREKEYQATLKLREDIEAGKKIQERGDGEGMPKFPIKHTGLEMPPDWVFEDFMAQRVPIGMVTGFTDD